MPTRLEFQELTRARLDDVRALYAAGRYDAAAYMCGYVVEFSLKACICRHLRLSEYPPAGGDLRRAFMTHSFRDLLLLAGLRNELSPSSNPSLFAKWSRIIGWNPEWRYRPVGSATAKDVGEMLQSLRGRDGVLTWLKRRW